MKNRIVALLLISALIIPNLAFSSEPAQADGQPSTFIVGGTEATRGAWPFMVGLFSKGFELQDGQFCGGSLIHQSWVLTAAHCIVEQTAENVQVGIALHDLRTDTGEVINVARIISHPNYDSNTNDNDIALLELENASSSGSIIARASTSDSLDGATATAIGWGLTADGDDSSASPVLLQVELPVVSNTACDVALGGGITSNMICAGFSEGGKDACQGDSGGPLVVNISGSHKLVGATSFGDGCAQPDRYGVYARVSEYDSFISQYVPEGEGGGGETSPTDGDFGLWNGFLGMIDIVELVNPSSSDVSGQVNIHDISGNLISSTNLTVLGDRQQDVILTALAGFSSNSYGVLQVSDNVDGRIFYYRPIGDGFSDFEFAFGLSLSEATNGRSFVGFNTFQPSADPLDAANVVANWLSIVNLEDSTETFTINKYAIDGALLSAEVHSIDPLQRRDVDGGHVNPGPSNVGLLEVVPSDSSADYLSQLMRYGAGQNGSYDFAFPLVAETASSSTSYVPLGTLATAQNWLEVINTSSNATSITVSFYDSQGNLLDAQTLALAAHAQAHLNATNVLGAGAIGSAKLEPLGSEAIVAQSMFYFRNTTTGGISAMYGSQARPASSGAVHGSFNLYLEMENVLRITNVSADSAEVTVAVSSAFSEGSSNSVSLAANASAELSLHDSATFGTISNSYGVVTVTAPTGTSLLTEILRVRRESDSNELQFVAPTSLKN